MIPDDMIKKAKAAYINKRRKTCSHDSLIAALEAVAPDIWDEGCEHGGRNGHSDSWRQDEEDPDLAHWPYDDNPYRIEHT